MVEINQFGSAPSAPGFSAVCQRCERELTDVLDGTLSTEEQARFDAHVAGCAECQEMLADARRGVAWLEMLRTHRPEPPSDLVDRILSRTAGVAAVATHPLLGSVATEPQLPLTQPALAGATVTVLPFVPRSGRPSLNALLQTRFAMTAAMAFFSVALTLNLLGLHLSDLHARDLRPSSLRRNASDLNARVFRYYESIRVVYELESRVRDLQHADDSEPVRPPALSTQPDSAQPDPTSPAQTPQASPGKNKPTVTSPAAPSDGTSHPGSTRGHSSGESHSHQSAPLGALPHPAPGSLRLLPTLPTPGQAVPVRLRLPRSLGQKGLRA